MQTNHPTIKRGNLINSEKGILQTPNQSQKYINLNGFPRKMHEIRKKEVPEKRKS